MAARARALGSFNTTLEIVAGLNNGAVQRLKRTWADVPRRERALFEELETFVAPSRSYAALREAVADQRAKRQPCVPYLGVYLGDLVMTDEGSKAELSPGIVNFAKLMAQAAVIEEVRSFTQANAPSAPVNARLRSYLIGCTLLPDEDAVWAASMDLEPRAGD